MQIDFEEAAALLQGAQKILILTHHNPDGDTLGSGFALLQGLLAMGKQARLYNGQPLPARYAVAYCPQPEGPFEPELVVAVDVASASLLGALEAQWGGRVDLCVDHHRSNTGYARCTLLRPQAAAAAEVVLALLRQMGCAITPHIASALYLGLTTDTGCFRFSNTTAQTHRTAAELIEAGAQYQQINEQVFESKSRRQVLAETMAVNTIAYFYNGRCAVMKLDRALYEKTGVADDELEGIASLPRQIEGVEIGITLKEKPGGSCRVSVRTTGAVDASALCARFGGGGHARAAGCTLEGGIDGAARRLVEVAGEFLGEGTGGL